MNEEDINATRLQESELDFSENSSVNFSYSFADAPLHSTAVNSSNSTATGTQDLRGAPPWLTAAAAVGVIVVGSLGNAVVVLAFAGQPWRRKALVLDRIVAAIAAAGALASLVIAPPHLYAAATGEAPLGPHACQVQALLLNLLSLAVIWCSALLAAERFFMVLSPHEHALTFSLLNLNVILAGILVLLLVEVSGPIYGWAQYTYLPDCSVCFIDPASRHIFSYVIIHTLAYVVLPLLVSGACVSKVVIHASRGSTRVVLMSQMVQTAGGVVWLCLAALLCLMLLTPYYIVLVLRAANWVVPPPYPVTVYWLHVIAVTCVYPVMLSLSLGCEMVHQISNISRYLHLYFFDRESLDEELELEDRRQYRLRLQVGSLADSRFENSNFQSLRAKRQKNARFGPPSEKRKTANFSPACERRRNAGFSTGRERERNVAFSSAGSKVRCLNFTSPSEIGKNDNFSSGSVRLGVFKTTATIEGITQESSFSSPRSKNDASVSNSNSTLVADLNRIP